MNQDLLTSIDDIITKINTDRTYSRIIKENMQDSLYKEAMRHSAQLELKDIEKLKKSERKELNRDLKNLMKGWQLLANQGIHIGTLLRLGKTIEPNGHPYEYTRHVDVRYGNHEGPSPQTLPYELNNIVESLRFSSEHTVLKAIDTHIEMVRAHPYEDGNGRAARLVSNFILAKHRIPPYIITAEEKPEYIKMIDNTLQDRKMKKSSLWVPSAAEEIFHDYIGEKILDNAKKIEEKLEKNRTYMITLNNIMPETKHLVKNRIKYHAKNMGAPVKINSYETGKKKSICLEVTGDLSEEQLDTVLNNARQKKKFNYQLDCHDDIIKY